MNARGKSLKGRMFRTAFVFLTMIPVLAAIAYGALVPECEIRNGIVYGTRNGVNLTIDVMTPRKPNGAAVATIVSGDWISPNRPLAPALVAPFLKEGFTVFAIHHLSQPEASVMESVEDVRRAIRFVKTHAAEYGIDASRIGLSGASSGGHLALMAVSGQTDGKADSEDPVERQSCSVAAIAVLFPLTDLVDLSGSKLDPKDGGPPVPFSKAFGMADRDAAKWKAVASSTSPLHRIRVEMPPVLIHHGTADPMIPVEQSRRYRDAMIAADHEVTLVERVGKGHGWITLPMDLAEFARWFTRKL